MGLSVAAGILGGYYFLCSVAFLLVVSRSFVRLRITNHKGWGWGWDDTFIVVAWAFLFIGLILIQMQVNVGLGKHMDYLTDPERNTVEILKLNTFFLMDNVVCMLITKVSISLFILRLQDDRWLRWTLYEFYRKVFTLNEKSC